MRIIISPAKKMRVDTDSLPYSALPQFLPRAERLMAALQAMTPEALQALWRCNAAIAAQNVERLARMDLRRGLTPAILSYEGIQYRYMAPGVFEDREFAYIKERLRIVSGFYGLLRPFDGVTPYRLEMQARLRPDGCRDLYDYWGDSLAAQLAAETDFVLNLASKEYSAAVLPHLPRGVFVLTCVFGELTEGKVAEKGTLCKMARGEMVRYLAERGAQRPEDVKDFHRLGYTYSQRHSAVNRFVFLQFAAGKL